MVIIIIVIVIVIIIISAREPRFADNVTFVRDRGQLCRSPSSILLYTLRIYRINGEEERARSGFEGGANHDRSRIEEDIRSRIISRNGNRKRRKTVNRCSETPEHRRCLHGTFFLESGANRFECSVLRDSFEESLITA